MNKKYEIQVPHSNYVSIVALSILFAGYLLKNMMGMDHISIVFQVINWLTSGFILTVIIIKVILTRRFGKQLKITEHGISTKHIELPAREIERIVIQGNSIQSIGIKGIGQRMISNSLHFRFAKEEEKHMKELKKWAEDNDIQIENGKIYRWI